ncbi:hypothetical protein QCD60_07795 [Pokkaliibacter sp. MBI-7]|uniref:hypothetical protein n=1 Tax=Pokkaliibacter sp. MBI-7 TaxID=3040600 RepID=UPI0024475215|nr:hypothetical protein [Pokkaliibacter sp. MBI-7]MDH2432465.1 hypothetical protein [Pokkaliibacter sp. MBI-7]
MKSHSWLTPLVVLLAIIGIGFALTSHTTVIVNGQPLDGVEKALAGFAGPLLAVLFVVVGVVLGTLAFIGASLIFLGIFAFFFVSLAFMVAPSLLPWVLGILALVWVMRKKDKARSRH